MRANLKDGKVLAYIGLEMYCKFAQFGKAVESLRVSNLGAANHGASPGVPGERMTPSGCHEMAATGTVLVRTFTIPTNQLPLLFIVISYSRRWKFHFISFHLVPKPGPLPA